MVKEVINSREGDDIQHTISDENIQRTQSRQKIRIKDYREGRMDGHMPIIPTNENFSNFPLHPHSPNNANQWETDKNDASSSILPNIGFEKISREFPRL